MSVICTLFEGDYHYGVGALANSLYAHGFRGTIYAGYRGSLPPWVVRKDHKTTDNGQQTGDQKSEVSSGNKRTEDGGQKAESGKQKAEKQDHKTTDNGQQNGDQKSVVSSPLSVVEGWGDFTDFSPAEGLTLRFIPLTTTIHLTNYKPDFMLEVWEKHCPQAESLFYFDPDIVVRFPWSFFEEWASDSVALCEDVNSPMPNTHPKRNAWRRLLADRGIEFKNQPGIYVNGGFVALSKPHQEFLKLWSQIIAQIAEAGASLNSFGSPEDYRFWTTDQDALNIAVMATNCPTSCAGKDGMGFVPCNSFMLHAVGTGKPWRTSLLRQFLAGKRPTPVQREYWEYVETPVEVFSSGRTACKRMVIKFAAFCSRFYGR